MVFADLILNKDASESWRGSIEVSKAAALQVLGKDIFEVPKKKFKIPVVMTIDKTKRLNGG
ncbi:MAG: hypothetical protein ACOX7U_01155 [Desulfitobacteriia bacterium]